MIHSFNVHSFVLMSIIDFVTFYVLYNVHFYTEQYHGFSHKFLIFEIAFVLRSTYLIEKHGNFKLAQTNHF